MPGVQDPIHTGRASGKQTTENLEKKPEKKKKGKVIFFACI
jgi:hypothetical protein